MHQQMRAVFIVEAIVLVCALGFSVFYFANGLYRTSHLLDVTLVVLWVLVAGVLLLLFRSREKAREQIVRRFYLSPEWIYNHEIGYAPISKLSSDLDMYGLVMFAADALAHMSYGFEVANAPENFQPSFVIESETFLFHLVGEETDSDNASVVVDEWKGTLQQVKHNSNGEQEFTEIGSFSNAKQLAELLDTMANNSEG